MTGQIEADVKTYNVFVLQDFAVQSNQENTRTCPDSRPLSLF